MEPGLVTSKPEVLLRFLMATGVATFADLRGVWSSSTGFVNEVEAFVEGRLDPDAADVTYYVRASLCGISVSSSALHRSKPAWSQVLPHHLVDPNVIQFEGQRLLVPLPAGCWADAGRRKLKIEVVEVTRQSEAKTLSFEEFSKVAGKDIMNHHKEQVKLKAMLTFDSHMLVDQQKTLGVFLVTPEQEEVQMDVFRNYKDETQRSEGMLSLDFCLRDRDHARATMGQAGQR
eukprot:symbB.v1.2.040580.t1/scaffold7350.1/size11775/1